MPTIHAQAIIPDTSPSDVIMVPLPTTSLSATAASAGTSIARARITGPELTVWLRDAINTLLAELPLASARPDGMLLEYGTCTHENAQVWAHDWYASPKHLPIAQCDAAETARRLRIVLNALLTAV